jgi:REP element-mobilizing transposase RayT
MVGARVLVAYLLTFNCYGTHLRGAEGGSVDRARRGRGGPIEASANLVGYANRAMTHAGASLDLRDALLVLRAIQEVCAFRNWTLLAAHVRSQHLHLVVDGIAETSGAIRDFKAYASRALNREEVRRRWARGGNVRLLGNSSAVRAAVRYVVDGQGPPMAVYIAPDL